jgi:aquaporin Z
MPMSKKLVAEFIGIGDWAIAQLWLFWVAPSAGALIAGFVYRWLADER